MALAARSCDVTATASWASREIDPAVYLSVPAPMRQASNAHQRPSRTMASSSSVLP